MTTDREPDTSGGPPGGRDPRQIVTPYAFRIADELMGEPLPRLALRTAAVILLLVGVVQGIGLATGGIDSPAEGGTEFAGPPVGRFGGYAASIATGLVGFLQVLWDANRQGLHDRIAGTVVLRETGGDGDEAR